MYSKVAVQIWTHISFVELQRTDFSLATAQKRKFHGPLKQAPCHDHENTIVQLGLCPFKDSQNSECFNFPWRDWDCACSSVSHGHLLLEICKGAQTCVLVPLDYLYHFFYIKVSIWWESGDFEDKPKAWRPATEQKLAWFGQRQFLNTWAKKDGSRLDVTKKRLLS